MTVCHTFATTKLPSSRQESSPSVPLGSRVSSRPPSSTSAPKSKLEVADPNTPATNGRVSTTRSLFITGPIIWDCAAGLICS
ncbi:MAG: hypothetical protein ACRDOH_31170 [Streptosporangiaceae bacterium]